MESRHGMSSSLSTNLYLTLNINSIVIDCRTANTYIYMQGSFFLSIKVMSIRMDPHANKKKSNHSERSRFCHFPSRLCLGVLNLWTLCPAQRPCSLHSGHPRISLCAVHAVNDFKEPRSCVRLLGFKGSREQWHAPETDKAVRRS